jgi:Tfp pilus assembly protein PilF
MVAGCDGRDEVVEIPQADTQTAQKLDSLDQALASGDIEHAERLVEQYQAAGMQHPRLAYISGRIAELRGDIEGTERAFLEATRLAPRWFEPKAALAQHYLRTGRIGSAQNLFLDLDKLFPHHPIGKHGQGMVALQQGDTAAAEAFLAAALKRDSDYPPSLYQMALLRLQQQNRVAARNLLGRYLTYVEGNPSAWITLGEINQTEGRLADARAYYQRALDLRHDQVIAARIDEINRMLP